MARSVECAVCLSTFVLKVHTEQRKYIGQLPTDSTCKNLGHHADYPPSTTRCEVGFVVWSPSGIACIHENELIPITHSSTDKLHEHNVSKRNQTEKEIYCGLMYRKVQKHYKIIYGVRTQHTDCFGDRGGQ